MFFEQKINQQRLVAGLFVSFVSLMRLEAETEAQLHLERDANSGTSAKTAA
jgi:hypothetical protein